MLLAQGWFVGPPAVHMKTRKKPHRVGAPAARTRALQRFPDLQSPHSTLQPRCEALVLRIIAKLELGGREGAGRLTKRHAQISLSAMDTGARYPTECNFLISAAAQQRRATDAAVELISGLECAALVFNASRHGRVRAIIAMAVCVPWSCCTRATMVSTMSWPAAAVRKRIPRRLPNRPPLRHHSVARAMRTYQLKTLLSSSGTLGFSNPVPNLRDLQH
jgi:hypothetical protein